MSDQQRIEELEAENERLRETVIALEDARQTMLTRLQGIASLTEDYRR